LIAVDSSALVAIALLEPDRSDLLGAIGQAGGGWLSPTNYLETGIVLHQRGRIADTAALDEWLAELTVGVREDLSLHAGALAAFRSYGKGRHPARLNLADCFAYALAKALDAPLLYKGDDFARTDIRSALSPQTPPRGAGGR
jgi:ribonuclease VapC